MEILQRIAVQLEEGDDAQVSELVQQAIDGGVPVETILDDALIAGMGVVGERFRRHDIFLPEVLLAARAMKAGLRLIEPMLIEKDVAKIGTVVIGTAHGDLHDIGKNLVAVMLQGAGFEVVDLGSDVAPERFVDRAVESGAAAIGVSALLTTTMSGMKAVVDLVRDRGLDIKVVVGGAPVTQDFADSIGADAYAFDAASAVERMRALVGAA